jgi:hypothetical protein
MIKEEIKNNNAGNLRTLYECQHARVHRSKIYCDRGHPIATQTGKSYLELRLLAMGKRLAMAYCQRCPDYISLGPTIPEEEKGWISRTGSGDPGDEFRYIALSGKE